MESIRIQNLRSLKDTGYVKLKPITILVGANSTGKSTFLRTLPLIKQGLFERTQGPILWYGSEVDFGSFTTALRHGSKNMFFSFKWDRIGRRFWGISQNQEIRKVSFSMTIEGDGGDAIVKEYEIQIGDDQNIKIVVDNEANCFVNDISLRDIYGPYHMFSIMDYGLMPMYAFSRKENDGKNVLDQHIDAFLNRIGVMPLAVKTLTPENVNLDTRKDVLESVLNFYQVEGNYQSMLDTPEFVSLNNVLLAENLQNITGSIMNILRAELSSLYYMKPFRASAERYYRLQNLAVDRLDSDGHNMAIFISNLYKNKTKKKNFQKWTKDHFDFELDCRAPEGHISLLIKEHDDLEFCNIADKGFGYSQILPVILMLWQVSDETRSHQYYSRLVVIEQPELHLHPRMQAQLMDAIIEISKLCKQEDKDVKIIFETHSQTMIERAGLRIAEGNYASDDISVLLFNEPNSTLSNPQHAYFKVNGHLINWPIGFFNPIF